MTLGQVLCRMLKLTNVKVLLFFSVLLVFQNWHIEKNTRGYAQNLKAPIIPYIYCKIHLVAAFRMGKNQNTKFVTTESVESCSTALSITNTVRFANRGRYRRQKIMLLNFLTNKYIFTYQKRQNDLAEKLILFQKSTSLLSMVVPIGKKKIPRAVIYISSFDCFIIKVICKLIKKILMHTGEHKIS